MTGRDSAFERLGILDLDLTRFHGHCELAH